MGEEKSLPVIIGTLQSLAEPRKIRWGGPPWWSLPPMAAEVLEIMLESPNNAEWLLASQIVEELEEIPDKIAKNFKKRQKKAVASAA